MSNRINRSAFEEYETYLLLLASYKELYQDLELQYQLCKCLGCKLRLITFGMEIISLNSFVEQLEAQITPDLNDILKDLKINFQIAENGQTEIVN